MAGARRLLIVGNGMAATRLLDELQRQRERHDGGAYADRFIITVIGEEAEPGYNRILLSPWLAGEKADRDIVTHDRGWYRQRGIQLHTGDPVTALDLARRRAVTAAGRVFPWDELVLATGARAARLDIPGADLDGLMCFRTLDDARRLRQRAVAGGRALVIGGGLLGLEAAHGLNRLGMEVGVVHNGDWLMNRQLDAEAGALLADTLRARGITIHTGARSARFIGDGAVAALELHDGTRLDCSLAVMALGIVPETRLARAAGLACGRAIQVDPWLRTGAPGVYALGECCQIDEELFGLVAPIHRQAAVLAGVLHGDLRDGYRREAAPTRLKISGVEVFSAGDSATAADHTLAWRDPQAGHYRRLWLDGGRLVAAVLFGEVDDGARYFDLMQRGARVTDAAALLFGGEAAA